MLDEFKAHLNKTGLVPRGVRVLVGLSGGADSVCLVHLMHATGFEVAAGHLHHGMRPEADAERDKCAEFADSLGIGFMAGNADVPAMSKDLKIGLEEAGRLARYQFFKSAAHQAECQLVATAHTLDDHIETVLLNLTRGAGLNGLAGIPERRENIIRPILPFTREQTRSYCQEHGLWFHDDPANLDVSFSRTRIRLNVVPELEKINSAVRSTMARSARIAAEDDEILNGLAARILEQAEVPMNGDLAFVANDCEVILTTQILAVQPPALVRRGIRLAASVVGGGLSAHQVEEAAQGIVNGGSGSVTSEGSEVHVQWNPKTTSVVNAHPTRTFRFPLTLPGETVSDEFGWQFTAAPDTGEGIPHQEDSLSVVIDQAAAAGGFHFRTAEPGDRIQPLGMSGAKKIFDIMGEMKLTQAAKARLPIVCDMAGPIWIPGGPIADRVKITNNTGRRLGIKFGPL
jgi:tRNA(Ile)-lysidine synthase